MVDIVRTTIHIINTMTIIKPYKHFFVLILVITSIVKIVVLTIQQLSKRSLT
jgi:hypothetical protein